MCIIYQSKTHIHTTTDVNIHILGLVVDGTYQSSTNQISWYSIIFRDVCSCSCTTLIIIIIPLMVLYRSLFTSGYTLVRDCIFRMVLVCWSSPNIVYRVFSELFIVHCGSRKTITGDMRSSLLLQQTDRSADRVSHMVMWEICVYLTDRHWDTAYWDIEKLHFAPFWTMSCRLFLPTCSLLYNSSSSHFKWSRESPQAHFHS